MLNKEICKRCRDSKFGSSPWDEIDEYFWEHGKVWCSYNEGGRLWQRETEEVPNWCPYVAEHVVLEGGIKGC